MGQKSSNLVAVAVGLNELSLKAEANESFLIRSVKYYSAAAAAENYSLSVDRRKVNQYVAPTGFGIGLEVPQLGLGSLVGRLNTMGLLRPIPVASGQTFSATSPGTGNAVQVVYDVYDKDDIKASDFNGSESSDFQLFQMVSNSTAATAAGDVELNASDLDSEFPAFPGGATVPSGKRVELLGLYGAAVSDGDGTDTDHYSTRLKLIEDRQDILDQDLVGMLLQGDENYTANSIQYLTLLGHLNKSRDTNGPTFYAFDTPLVFTGGTELNAFITFAAGAGGVSLGVNEAKLGLVLNYYGV